jgi:hypothetical protein
VLPANTFDILLYAAGPLTFCEGLSVRLDAPGGYDFYLWNTGDTTRSIFATKSGSYYCSVRLGNSIGYSDTLQVIVQPAPKPIIAVLGSNPLCPGDSLTLDASVGYAAYYWSTGESTHSISVKTAGEYFVTVTSADGCPGGSDTVTVVMAAAAWKPVITRILDSLTSTEASSWQWYRNGQPIPGDTLQGLRLSDTGTYSVLIVDANGCTAMSDPFDVSVLDVEMMGGMLRSFDVYPNPSNGSFSVALELERPQTATITVTDVLGRQLINQRVLSVSSRLTQQIDLYGYPAGPYIIRIALARRSMTRMVTLR